MSLKTEMGVRSGARFPEAFVRRNKPLNVVFLRSNLVDDVVFRFNTIRNASTAAFIKTGPARSGFVRNVSFESMRVDSVEQCFKIQVNYNHFQVKNDMKMTEIDGIQYKNWR